MSLTALWIVSISSKGHATYLSLLLCSEKRSEANLTMPSSYRYTLRGFRQVTTTYTLRSYCIHVTPQSVTFGIQVTLMQTRPADKA